VSPRCPQYVGQTYDEHYNPVEYTFTGLEARPSPPQRARHQQPRGARLRA
jgi:hypothetical protein